MEPFLGQLLLASFNFAPRGFAMANGQLMSIQQNTALFSVLGTYFGGNGVNNFALPNLQGRVPVHQGNFQGNVFNMGQIGGEEAHTLTSNEMPVHTHQVTAASTAASTDPNAGFLAGNGAAIFNSLANVQTMNQGSIANAGGSQPHEDRQPFLVMTWVIALSGIFPSRS